MLGLYSTSGSKFKNQSIVENHDTGSKIKQPEVPKFKNGLDDHQKLVENFVRQGAKFQKTLKYGFPLVTRKLQINENTSSRSPKDS